jgi:hypothetical protein
MSEIAAWEGVSLSQPGNWKREFPENAHWAFSKSCDGKDAVRRMNDIEFKEK